MLTDRMGADFGEYVDDVETAWDHPSTHGTDFFYDRPRLAQIAVGDGLDGGFRWWLLKSKFDPINPRGYYMPLDYGTSSTREGAIAMARSVARRKDHHIRLLDDEVHDA